MLPPHRRARAAMALSKLSADEHGIIIGQLCNPLEPRLAWYFSSASSGLRVLLTPALRQQLSDDHEAASALCCKMGTSCKKLREARSVSCIHKGLSAADFTTLGKLGSVLPALVGLTIIERSGAAGPDGVQRLVMGLGAGALPAVRSIFFGYVHVGDAGASALAAALGRGALPRLEELSLIDATIGDAGLVALAPALRRLPALARLRLLGNPLGDEGIAALVAPPPPAGALPLPIGGLKKLKLLDLMQTQVTDAGCTALAAALDSGMLPALGALKLDGIPASATAKEAVDAALARCAARALLAVCVSRLRGQFVALYNTMRNAYGRLSAGRVYV